MAAGGVDMLASLRQTLGKPEAKKGMSIYQRPSCVVSPKKAAAYDKLRYVHRASQAKEHGRSEPVARLLIIYFCHKVIAGGDARPPACQVIRYSALITQ